MYEYYFEAIEVRPVVVDGFEFSSIEIIKAMFQYRPPREYFLVKIYQTEEENVYHLSWMLPLMSNN